MKRTRVAAIDVGTTKVCAIMGDIDEKNNTRVLGVGTSPSNGLSKGMITNINEARDSIRSAVRQAERSTGYKMESAFIGVTGRHVNSINQRGAVAISREDRLVRPEDMKRVMEAAKAVEIPGDQRVLHVIPRSYSIDGQEGIRNPVGMHGFRLDVETHVITAAVTSIQNLTKCVRSIGIEIEDLILEPLAAAEAVLSPDEKMDGVLLADIGGNNTNVAIFKDNAICHTSILPVGGYQITRDISIGLGLPFEVAEDIKLRYGDVSPIRDDGTYETGRTFECGHDTLSVDDLNDIIRARTDEIIRLVTMEIPQKDVSNYIPSGMVITGGCSNLGGISAMSKSINRLPVRIGMPVNLSGVSETLYNPAFSTSVGLMLWRARNNGAESPKVNSKLRHMVSPLMRLLKH